MVLKREVLSIDANEDAATARLRVEVEIAEAGFDPVGGAKRFLLDADNRAEPPLGDGDMCVPTVSWAILEEPNDAHGEVGLRGADARGSRIVGAVTTWQMTLLGGQVPGGDPELKFTSHEPVFRRDYALGCKLSAPDTLGAAARLLAVPGGYDNRKRDAHLENQIMCRRDERLSAATECHRIAERHIVGNTLAESPESLCTVKEVGEGQGKRPQDR